MRHDDPREVVLIVFMILCVMGLSSLVVRFDEKRLDEESLERAWPETSRDSALIGLAFLASPLLTLFAVAYHFVRTRRYGWKGFLLGIFVPLAIVFCLELLGAGLAWAIGLPLE
jgi:hypothetical protein